MRLRDRLVISLAATAAGVAVFGLGGASRGAQAAVAVLVAAALVIQLSSRARFGRVSPLIGLLGLAAGLTAAQLVPLPGGLVAALDPIGSELRLTGARLAGVSAATCLSLDVPGTLRALAFGLTLLGVARVALRVAVTARGRYLMLAGVALLCGLAALVTGVHELLGLDRLYGVYAPAHATPAVLGPLLNENQLGCLMAIGAVLSLGLIMYVRQRSWWRAIWLGNLVTCAVATVASHSRGATLALVAGVVVTGALLAGHRVMRPAAARRPRERLAIRSIPIGVVAACAVVVMVYANAGQISHELSRTTLAEIDRPSSKYATWRSAADLVEETPWVGIGRGAFEPVFTRFHAASAFSTFSHLENEYLQAVVDWGVPGALVLGAAAVWLVVAALRKWRDSELAAGGIGAIAVVALQSNVDFGLELLGISVPLTIIAATLTYVPLREASDRSLVISRGLGASLAVSLIAVAALLLTEATSSPDDDHGWLRAHPASTLAELRPMIERHPLDYYGYALAAQLATRDRSEPAIQLLNHAMRLHPTHPGLHLMAARLLYTQRKQQAATEYAAAIRYVRDPSQLISEIVAVLPVELAVTAITVDSHPPGDVVPVLEASGHPDVAVAWLARVLETRPGNLRICEMLYDLAVKHSDLRAVDMAMQHCAEFQPSPTSQLQLARVLLQRNELAAAIAVLKDVETWAGRVDIKVTAWFVLCDAYIAQHAWNDARRCVRRLEVSGDVPAELVSETAHRLETINREIDHSAMPP